MVVTIYFNDETKTVFTDVLTAEQVGDMYCVSKGNQMHEYPISRILEVVKTV